MRARGKSAPLDEGAELDKKVGELPRFDIEETEFTDAGRVDYISAGREREERNGRGSVPALSRL